MSKKLIFSDTMSLLSMVAIAGSIYGWLTRETPTFFPVAATVIYFGGGVWLLVQNADRVEGNILKLLLWPFLWVGSIINKPC